MVAEFTTIILIFSYLLEEMRLTRVAKRKEPLWFQDLTKKKHMKCILRSVWDYCISYLRMDVGPFMHLASIKYNKHLLVDNRYISIEEQLVIILHIVGHNTKKRTMRAEFLHSGETFSWNFNYVSWAIFVMTSFIPKQHLPSWTWE